MMNGSFHLAWSNAKIGLALASCGTRNKLAVLLGIAAIGDWLFYKHPAGISIALFLIAIDLGVIATNPVHATRRELMSVLGIFVLAIMPLMVEPTLVTTILAAIGAACLALTAARGGMTFPDRIFGALALLVSGWRAFADLLNSLAQWKQNETWRRYSKPLVVWIVPLVLSGIFLELFASANPVIDGWLEAIDLAALFAHIDADRVLFWIIMILFAWPFIFMQVRNRMRVKADLSWVRPGAPATRVPTQLFGKAAILRSLVLFNLLFAVQTALDVTYLWGGVALPDGMSYASYAHRGAYPLVVTALLAAAFVIAATRPGSEAADSRLVRTLVFLWTGQNVLLVISSILRLDLYIEVYSLTTLRVAAFIWMMLVALGLVLIVARIALGRSNGWLIRMNLSSLAITLYVCLFINFPGIIASYNVAHSREITGAGAELDLNYLLSLGPQVIPAIDRFIALRPNQVAPDVVECRNERAAKHLARMTDWRAWSYRDWQLARYLRENPRAANPRG